MIPIFWRYLLKNYFKVLFLSVFSFIAILFVSRLEEISQFAALGAKFSTLALFTFYQIPYILPLAIPISCLLSTILLFQRLSHTHELTALRAGGISLWMVISPILIASAFLSMGCFYISSELATSSHMATRKMVHDLTSVNPILLLQSAKIAKLQRAYIQMDPLRNGEAAKDLIIVVNNLSNGCLNLCLAKKIEMQEKDLVGKQVTLISSASSKQEEDFDHLVIENQETMRSFAPEFAHLLRKQGWKIANDHLKLSLLRVRSQRLKKEISSQPFDHSKLSRNLEKCRSEMVRRFSMGMAAFTFSLMGIAFGMDISRNRHKKEILIVLLLTATSLVSFFVAKEFDHLFWISSLLFLLPHFLICALSILTLCRINRGIE